MSTSPTTSAPEPSSLHVNQETMAKILGVTARAIRNWKDCPRQADGSYSTDDVLAWFAARFAGRDALNQQLALLARARSASLEMANADRRAQLLDADIAQAAFAVLLKEIQRQTRRLPKLAEELAVLGDPNSVRGLLAAELYKILLELSTFSPSAAAIEAQLKKGQRPGR